MKSVGTEVERTIFGRAEKVQGNVLQVLEEVITPSQVDSPFPFCGGAVGYIGYDVIRQYENIGADLHDPLNIPEVHLLLYREFIVYDHLRQKLSFVYVCREDDSADYEEVYERLQIYKEEVLQEEEAEVTEIRSTLSFTSSITKKFCAMVETAKEYIGAGDIFQVVLSQRLQSECIGDPFALYRKLRIANPSPYMFYIDFQDYVVLGSSPESLLSVREDKVMTNPIAGTRPRGKTKQEDAEIEKNC